MEHEIIDFCEFWFKDGLAALNIKHLHKYQKDFLLTCVMSLRIAGIWARQSGKSVCVAIYSLYMCMTHPNFRVMIIAPTQNQSSELYNKLRKIAEGSALIRGYIKSAS